MDTVLEILKIILPAAIAALSSFLVTKYNYHKNIPLDKLEIAYNRVYYPIYCLVNDNENVSQVIEKSDMYLKKYRKYVDRSTIVAFRYLKKNERDKKAYSNFKDNIYAENSKLRNRLGYLEPNIFSMYTYAAPSEKRVLRLVFELLGIYISLIGYSIINVGFWQKVILSIFSIAILGLLYEVGILIYEFIEKCIKKNFCKPMEN